MQRCDAPGDLGDVAVAVVGLRTVRVGGIGPGPAHTGLRGETTQEYPIIYSSAQPLRYDTGTLAPDQRSLKTALLGDAFAICSILRDCERRRDTVYAHSLDVAEVCSVLTYWLMARRVQAYHVRAVLDMCESRRQKVEITIIMLGKRWPQVWGLTPSQSRGARRGG